MAKYLKRFETHSQYEAFTATTEFILPNVSYCVQEDDVHYNPSEGPQHDYSQDYLTFTALENGTFQLSGNSVSYSLDDGATWTTLASNTRSPTVNSGNTIMWKGELTPQSGIGKFYSTGKFEVQGNPMSLLYGDNFKGQTSLQGKNYAFFRLFSGCTGLESAENLSLPATTLASNCYGGMFDDCWSLTTAPSLPATTLADNCYASMFENCTSLTTAPELPATTLATRCYASMFAYCASLTTAPQLPATTLADYCYASMFENCESLTTAPSVLPATTLADYCYYWMFMNCTSLTTAPSLPATTLADYCYQEMFEGCVLLTTAPSLLATTLAQGCYYYMFFGCTSLTTAPDLLATTLEYECYFGMFYGCSSLNYIKCLATDISAQDCTSAWVLDVAASGTFVKAAGMDGWDDVEEGSGIPENWAIQTAT